MEKKKILLAFTNRDSFLKKREELINTASAAGKLTGWSDFAVETPDVLYVLRVLPAQFHAAELEGYDEVRADEVIEKLEKALAIAKSYCVKGLEPAPVIPTAPIIPDVDPADAPNLGRPAENLTPSSDAAPKVDDLPANEPAA